MHPALFADATIGVFLIAAIGVKAPDWVLVWLLAALMASVVVTLVIFCIFIFIRPDVIRSETYNLRRMEIEQAAMGDDRMGVIDPSKKETPLLPQSSEDEISDE
jgi:membrane protein YdbS with pleckstrin-like domain